MAARASRASMGGAVRLKRSNSGSTDIDRSLDIEEQDEEQDDDEGYSPGQRAKRRKSTIVWESSPKRETRNRSLVFSSEPVSAVSAASAAASVSSVSSVAETADISRVTTNSSSSSSMQSNDRQSSNNNTRRISSSASSKRSSCSSTGSTGSEGAQSTGSEHAQRSDGSGEYLRSTASGHVRPGSGEYIQRLRSSSEARLSALKPWSLEEFTLGKALGKGRFGNVYLAKQKRTNVQLAFKVLFKAPMQSAQCVNALRREVEIQCRIKHKNIVNMFGYFRDAKNVYLLLEYLSGGELYKKMKKSDGFLSECTCRTYMRDIASGLGYMHARGVMHRDIKPENILIGEDGRLRLTDLGYTMCGTPEYLAPEMIAGTGHTLTVDLWALGILLYEMLYGRTPFYERQRQSSGEEDVGAAELEARTRMYGKIQGHKGDLKFPALPVSSSSSSLPSTAPPSSSFSARRTSTVQSEAPPSSSSSSSSSLPSSLSSSSHSSSSSSSLSPEGQSIVLSLLRKDPTARMTAQDILSSDWLVPA